MKTTLRNLGFIMLIVVLAQSVWAQEEVPVIHTVDDSGGADFATIQAAIDAAAPGDIVQVASGTYTEALTIGKDLTLRAAEGSLVILSDASSTGADGVSITAGDVTIEGITIDYDQVGAAGIDASGVGPLTLRDLVISANADGVSAWDASWIVIENVDVTNSGDDGLDLGALGPISVSGGSVTDVPNWGVWAQGSVVSVDGVAVDGGAVGIEGLAPEVTITNNEVNNTDGSGIYVEADDATITDNMLADVGDGIAGGINGDGTFTGNTITRSQHDGIYLWYDTALGGTITVTSNIVGPVGLGTSYGWGIDLDFSGEGEVFDLIVDGNRVDGALSYAIEADSDGNVLITGNSVNDVSEGSGIDAYGAVVTITDNEVSLVSGTGIYAEAGEGVEDVVTVTGNTITDADDDGIEAFGGAVTLIDNEITSVGDDGIHVDATGDVLVTGNSVSDVWDEDGIYASGGHVEIRDNVVANTGEHGIYGTAWALRSVIITGNDVSDAGYRGIYAAGPHVEILDNLVDETSDTGIYAEAGGIDSAIVNGNSVTNSSAYGIFAYAFGDVTVDLNTVTATDGAGIYAESFQGDVLVTLNSVSETGEEHHGIQAYGLHVEVIGNIVSETGDDGIYADAGGEDSVVILGNEITNATGDGIGAYSAGAATIADNTIESTGSDGIYVDAYDATITGNTVLAPGEDGIYAYLESGDLSSSTISGNTVDARFGRGIGVYTYDSEVSISDNILTRAEPIFIAASNEGLTINGNFFDEFSHEGFEWLSDISVYAESASVHVVNNTISGGSAAGVVFASDWSSFEVSNNSIAGPLIGIAASGNDNLATDIVGNTITPLLLGVVSSLDGEWCIMDNVITLPAEPVLDLEASPFSAAGGIFVDTAFTEAALNGGVVNNHVSGAAGSTGVFWYPYAYEGSLGDVRFHDNTLVTQVGFVIDVGFPMGGGVSEYPISFNDLSGTEMPFAVCDLLDALVVVSEDLAYLTCLYSGGAIIDEGDLSAAAPLNYYGHAGPPIDAGLFAPIGVEPFLTAAPDPNRTTDNVQTFGFFLEVAGPEDGEAPEPVGIGAPTGLARPLHEMFDADFVGVVYEFDAGTQSWVQSLGDETLGPLEARLVLPTSGTRVLMDFADSIFEVPQSREVQAGWNFQAPRQFSTADTAFDGGTLRTFEVFDLFGQPEQHVDHDGLIYGFELGEEWEEGPYVDLSTLPEWCMGPIVSPYSGYFTSYLSSHVITSVIPAGVAVDDWQQYVPDTDCVEVDLPSGDQLLLFYQDMDLDGYGDNTMTILAASQPFGYAAVGGDCLDSDPTVNPGAPEIMENGKDDDCAAETPDSFS